MSDKYAELVNGMLIFYYKDGDEASKAEAERRALESGEKYATTCAIGLDVVDNKPVLVFHPDAADEPAIVEAK